MKIDTDEKREKRQTKFDTERQDHFENLYKKTGNKMFLHLANKEGIDTDWNRDDDQFN